MAEINHEPKGQFYQSPFFLGCGSAFITIIVTVIAAMTKDSRWLLVVAWPFAGATVWEFARTWGSPRRIKSVASAGSGVAAIALVALYFWLAPEAPPIPTAHEPANPTRFVQPVLSLIPVERDAHISWPSPQTAPKTNDGKSPFALVVRNIGGSRALHLEARFFTSLTSSALVAELHRSRVFPDMTTENNELQLPLVKVRNRVSFQSNFGFISETIKRVEMIDFTDNKNESLIEYPGIIQSLLDLWILSNGFSQGEREIDRGWHDSRLPSLLTEDNKGELVEYFRKMQGTHLVLCPDVSISLHYEDLANNKHVSDVVIRSLYQMVSPPKWVYEDERREKIYFDGGSGTLSFEDNNNPDQGFYNIWKMRGVIPNSGR
jgi:hypothetical protein